MRYYNSYDLSPVIKDKARYMNNHLKFMLNRSIAMFEYGNLPETISQFQIEQVLQTAGSVTVLKHEGNIYALNGTLGGEQDAEGRPTLSTVVNPALGLSKTFTIGKDCIVIDNDVQRMGLMPIYKWYGSLLCEGGITIYNSLILERAKTFISASDDKTLKSASLFIKSLEKGDLSVIGASAFFEGVKSFTSAVGSSDFKSLIEIMQYLKASELNDIGLNANWNAKREALGANETALNDDYLYPFIDVMMRCRRTGIDAVNRMFGTSIMCELSSSWEQTQFEKRGLLPKEYTDGEETAVIETAGTDEKTAGTDEKTAGTDEKTAGTMEDEAGTMEDEAVIMTEEVKAYLDDAVRKAVIEIMKQSEKPKQSNDSEQSEDNGGNDGNTEKIA